MGIELLISNPVYGVGVQSANHFTTSSDVQRSEFWWQNQDFFGKNLARPEKPEIKH